MPKQLWEMRTPNPSFEQSLWYVFTGRSSSGISTTLGLLKKRGFKVINEAARDLIDRNLALGVSPSETRIDEAAFQMHVFQIKVQRENDLAKDQIYLFDRAIPDSVPYYANCGLDPANALQFCKRGFYRKVFFLEPLSVYDAEDYARTNLSDALLGAALRKTYVDLGYDVVSIPVMPPAERAAYVLRYFDV